MKYLLVLHPITYFGGQPLKIFFEDKDDILASARSEYVISIWETMESDSFLYRLTEIDIASGEVKKEE